MESFTKHHIIEAVKQAQQLMEENKEYLAELDSAIGDGDLGLTMTKGFKAALEMAESSNDTDLGLLLKKIGFAMAKAAPSTMGTLIATAFVGAGKALDGNENLNADQITLCFRSMAEAVSLRGRAKEGEKTLLDVLFPVARALEACESSDICIRLKTAVEAANEGLEQTRKMINQHGKAAVFREKSLGLLDPGAAAACFLVEGFSNACKI